MIRSAIHRTFLHLAAYLSRATVWCSLAADKFRPENEEKLRRVIEEVRELARKEWN
jgi:hypothetical protein